MLADSLTSVAATGFAVAFFHAALPTHWLPFVLVGQAKNWGRRKTLSVALVAGVGHIFLTSLLGLVIACLGFQIDERLERTFPWLAGGILLATGGYYSWRQWRGLSVCRHFIGTARRGADACCGSKLASCSNRQDRSIDDQASDDRSDWELMGALFMMLTLSPCEGFLPIYLSGVQFGWRGFVVLSAILAIATLFGMLLFTAGALLGAERLRVRRLERYSAGVLGALFGVLGLVTILHGH